MARIFDKNYDGYIDKDEFKWMTTSDIISKKTIKTVFERCDVDGDGKLDYQEFKAMIFRYRARKEEEGRSEPVKCDTKEKRKRMENTNTMNNNFAF